MFRKFHASVNYLRVLLGAEATLLSFKPVILFEQNRLASQALGLDPLAAARFLVSYGYALYQLKNGQLLSHCLEDLIEGNILAIYPGGS